MPFATTLDDPALPVSVLMTRWPETIGVFLRHRMLCVGCMVGPFHTVAEACREYRIDESAFRRALAEAVRAGPSPPR